MARRKKEDQEEVESSKQAKIPAASGEKQGKVSSTILAKEEELELSDLDQKPAAIATKKRGKMLKKNDKNKVGLDDAEDYAKSMDEYVEEVFKSWKWHSKAEHLAWVTLKAKKRDACQDPKMKMILYHEIQKAKKERHHHVKSLEMEYLLTRIANIEKMKYNPEKKQFHVKCSFVGPNPRTNVMEEQKEEMIVEEWFMNDILPKYLVKQCKTAGRNLDGNYHTVPKSKHFRLNDKPIVAVKFFPSVTRTVKDQDYIREEARKKMDQRLLENKSKEIYDLEQAMEQGEPAPVKEKSIKEKWHARTNDRKFLSLEEDVLVQKLVLHAT